LAKKPVEPVRSIMLEMPESVLLKIQRLKGDAVTRVWASEQFVKMIEAM